MTDAAVKHALQSPAPHDYGFARNPNKDPDGRGKFSNAFPLNALDDLLRAKKNIPGPGAYDTKAPQGNYVGKCNLSRTPSIEDRRLVEQASRPGPLDYAIGDTLVKNPGVTKWPKIITREEAAQLASQYSGSRHGSQAARSHLGSSAASADQRSLGSGGRFSLDSGGR